MNFFSRADDSGEQKIAPHLILVLAGFIIILFGVHGQGLNYGFNGEDFNLALPLSQYSILKQGGADTQMYFRPFWHFWFACEYELFHLNDFLYHLTHYGLHLINMLLAFTLFRRLKVPAGTAFIGVGLWTILGQSAYSILWINQSSDLFSMLFLLLAFHLWVSYMNNGQTKTFLLLSSHLIWLLSMFSKEMGFLFPVVSLALTAAFNLSIRPGQFPLKPKQIAIPLFFLFTYVGIKFAYHGHGGGFAVGKYAQSELTSAPLALSLLGHAIHYMEGVFYTLLPLDILNSPTSIIIGLLVVISCLISISMLMRRYRHEFNIPLLLYCAFCTAAFCAHASVNPHPRTLYVASLWTALGLAHIFSVAAGDLGASSRSATKQLAIISLTALVLVHLHAGEYVNSLFTPRSDNVIDYYYRRLYANRHPLPEEKLAYIREKLVGIDLKAFNFPEENIDSYGESGVWRKFAKESFEKYVKRERPK